MECTTIKDCNDPKLSQIFSTIIAQIWTSWVSPLFMVRGFPNQRLTGKGGSGMLIILFIDLVFAASWNVRSPFYHLPHLNIPCEPCNTAVFFRFYLTRENMNAKFLNLGHRCLSVQIQIWILYIHIQAARVYYLKCLTLKGCEILRWYKNKW